MLTEAQKKTAEAIVNIFEISSAQGNYGAVTLIQGDTGHLTYGRSQASLTSGNLHHIIKAYCDAPGAQLAGNFRDYLARLSSKDLSLDQDMPFRALLKQAGADPIMQTVQDTIFEQRYWMPAVTAAERIGIALPLGVAVVYDSHIHGSWQRIRDRTNGGIRIADGEQAWLRAYVQIRHDWLANHSRADLHATVYRMKAFQSLIEQDKWDLALPMKVRGVTIDHEVLRLTPDLQTTPLKIVLLADNRVIECDPRVEEGRTRVNMRAVCEALQIALPTGEALTALRPEVIPPGVTRVDLRPLAENNGWEVLTHRMAEDHKIYMKKARLGQ